MALLRVTAAAFVTLLVAGCSPDDGGGEDPAGASEPFSYIRGDEKTKLVFELDTVDGVSARTEAREYVVDRVGAVVDKPDGVEFVEDGTVASMGPDHVWTFAELQQVAKGTLDLDVDEDTAKIHILYVDGSYEDDVDGGATLGVAWKNKHIAMFADSIDASCERPLLGDRLCPVAESSVLLHEVGHVLGLVNNGIEMVEDHQDEDHGAHDDSDGCVMFWAYEGARVTDILEARLSRESPELDFGDECLADLAAVRDQ